MSTEPDHFPDPRAVVPGYETDPAATGTGRVVDPDVVDDVAWSELYPLTAADLARGEPDASA